MKLQIDKKIRQYRRQADITQEDLARILGVSSQSVSKWETGEGYPDITLLPAIANHFGISVDELIGNDDSGRQADLDSFREQFNALQGQPEEQVALALNYYRKYPKEYWVADMLGDAIIQDWAHLHENYPVLKEACERILDECTWYWTRENAVHYMCMACPDDEFAKWNDMCPSQYGMFKGEVLEERLWKRDEISAYRIRRGVNNLLLMCHFLNISSRQGTAEQVLAWESQRRRTVESFSRDGVVPSAWIGSYAESLLRSSWYSFIIGNREDGYTFLEQSCIYYEKWAEIPKGTPLDTGDPLVFFGVKAVKKSWDIAVPNLEGDYKTEWSPYGLLFMQEADDIYCAMTTNDGWGWMLGCKEGFDRIRGEERFLEILQKAKTLAEMK